MLRLRSGIIHMSCVRCPQSCCYLHKVMLELVRLAMDGAHYLYHLISIGYAVNSSWVGGAAPLCWGHLLTLYLSMIHRKPF